MQLGELLTIADEMKPNTFSETVKTRWVNEIEGMIQTEVLLLAFQDCVQYKWPDSKEIELLVPPPYDKLYEYYLESMILFQQEEMDRYANLQAMFQKCYAEYVQFIAETIAPSGCRAKRACYYLSAYGLAVKMGFQGTLEEWLKSLIGDKGDKGDPFTFEDFTSEQWQQITDGLQDDVLNELLPIILQAIEDNANTAADNAAEGVRQEVETAATAAQEAAETVEAYATKPPVVRDGVWFVWDRAAQDYVSTGQTAEGRDGNTGPQGPKGVDGVSVEANGAYQFSVTDDGRLIFSYLGTQVPFNARIDERGHLMVEV